VVVVTFQFSLQVGGGSQPLSIREWLFFRVVCKKKSTKGPNGLVQMQVTSYGTRECIMVWLIALVHSRGDKLRNPGNRKT
jgi:hypothetical protein